jgi:hypothetical protein
MNTHEGAITGALTLLLVLLYFGQYRTLERQTELNNRPYIDIEKREVDGNELYLWLSNLGNGSAIDIELKTDVSFVPTENAEPAPSDTSRLRKVGDEGDPKKRIGKALKSGESRVKFVGKPVVSMKMRDLETERAGMVSATGRLAYEGVDEIEIECFVHYSDLLGNEYSESVFGPYSVEINEEGLTTEDIKSNGQVIW